MAILYSVQFDSGLSYSVPFDILFCSLFPVLVYPILFYITLFCSVLFCSVLFCSVLFCSVLFCSMDLSLYGQCLIVVTVCTTAAYNYLCLKDENGKEQCRTRIHSSNVFCDVFASLSFNYQPNYKSKYKYDLLLMYSGKSVFAPYPQGDEKGALSNALRGRISWSCSDHKP
jgi:hypothetical protein